MKTIKIFCLFTFLFIAFVSCENEDGEVCYDPGDFGIEVTETAAADANANSEAEEHKPNN